MTKVTEKQRVKKSQQAFFDRYQPDPIAFQCEVLDVKPEHVWHKMVEVAEGTRDNQKTCVFAGHSVSKAVSIDTPVLTATGFKPIRDIKVGDKVYNEAGRLSKVTVSSPVQSLPACKVTFDDNSSVIAHDKHLWNVHDHLTRKRLRRENRDYRKCWNETKTVTTKWIKDNVRHNGQNNISIPLTMPLKGKGGISFPYTLGYWLGNGTRGCSQITVSNKDSRYVLANIRKEGFKVVLVPSQTQTNCKCYCIRGFVTQLKKLGIHVDKRIPEQILFASQENRLAVLQGLMDADGFKLCHGHSAALGTTDKLLFDSMIAVIASLSIKVFVSTETIIYKDRPKLVYKFNFSTDLQPFRLDRKKITASPKYRRRQARMVVKVEPAGISKVKCISVESGNALYLCSEHLIPTHNTYELARIALWFLYTHKPSTVITTAPIFDQVEKLLWKEIHTAHSQAKISLGGNMTKTQLDLDLEQKWFAYGFSTKPDTVTGEATRMQGYHNKYVLIIFDEAAGIPPAIWKAADFLLTNPNCKIVAVGNPTSSSGSFADCEDDPTWHFIRISVKDTPNFKEGREVIPEISGRAFEADMRRKYGEQSSEYGIRVEGRKPEYTAGTYLGKWLSVIEDNQVGFISHEPTAKVCTVWDYGNVYNAIWFVQFLKEQIRLIDFYFDGEGLGLPKYAAMLKEKPYIYDSHYAPPDLWGSNAKSGQTGQYTSEVAKLLGIDFVQAPTVTFDDRIEAARGIVPKCWFSEAAREGFNGLKNWRQRKNEALSTPDKPVYFKDAVKDWTRHVGDAFGYLAIIYRYMSIGGEVLGKVTQTVPADPNHSAYDNNVLTRGLNRHRTR